MMFPPSNSLSSADTSYFHMIQKEGGWGRLINNRSREKDKEERIQSAHSLSSNSLSQADRDYFNIVKIEDGLSHFIKVGRARRVDFEEVVNNTEKKAESDPKLSNFPVTFVQIFFTTRNT